MRKINIKLPRSETIEEGKGRKRKKQVLIGFTRSRKFAI